jgi:hypothetical protein
MTSEPFNIQPTVDMHFKLAKTAWRQRGVEDFLYHMRAAYDIMDETRRKRRAARDMVESYLLYPRFGGIQIDPGILGSRGFADAVYAYNLLRLRVMHETATIEHLARLLLTRREWKRDGSWQRGGLPRAIEEWKDFLPETFFYPIQSGIVKFLGRTKYGDGRLHAHEALQVRRRFEHGKFRPDAASTELDDDIIWAGWRDRTFYRDLSSPLLQSLFEPIRLDLDVHNSDPLLPEGREMFIDDEASAEFEDDFFESTTPPNVYELENASREQRQQDLQHTFGSFLDEEGAGAANAFA